MRDLEDRLRGVDHVTPPPPDWREVERRGQEPRAPLEPTLRLAPVLVAAAVAILGGVLVVRAFGGLGDRAAEAPTTPGGIVFTDVGPAPADIPFDNVDVYAWDPSTGERSNLTNSPTVAEESLVWSPDHTQVVFARTTATGSGADFGTRAELVVADADFTDQRVIRPCDAGCVEARNIAWSPDARSIALAVPLPVEGGWVDGLVIVELATGETTTLCGAPTGCGHPGQPAWSPDGTRIAYSNSGSMTMHGPIPPSGPIWVADVSTGKTHAVTDVGKCSFVPGDDRPCVFDSSPQWGTEARTIVFVRESRSGSTTTKSVMSIGADGGDERTLTTCEADDRCTLYDLAMAPDRTRVAVADRFDRPTVLVVDTATGETSTYTVPGASNSIGQVSWSPDGADLAVLSGDRRADLSVIDLETGQVAAELPDATSWGGLWWLSEGAVSLGLSEAPPPPASGTLPALPDGTIVFSSSSGSASEDDATEIWSIRTDGSGLTQLTDNDAIDVAPALSPDGTRIAFASYREGDRNTQIYVMNADGSDQQVLTDLRTGAGRPVWSPDGTTIAFISGAGWGEPGGVFVVEPGFGDPWLVGEGNVMSATWSSDSTAVIYARSEEEGDGVWTAPIRVIDCIPGPCSEPPGIPTELFSLPGTLDDLALAPDGRTLAFTWSSSRGGAIYTSDQDGGNLKKIAVGDSPTWSPNGEWLAFTHTDDTNGPQIWVMRRDGSEAAPLTSLPGFIPGTQIYGITRDPSWGDPG